MGLAAEKVKRTATELRKNLTAFGRWLLYAIFTGGLVGLVGTAFYFGMRYVTAYRQQNGWIVWLLPAAGALIVYLYRLNGVEKSQGTNLILLAVRSPEPIPMKMGPLIFISTLITHLFGGSAGREGAALQLGGSLGFQLGKMFRLDEKDLHIITMCGMSAAFSALFGTPVTSAVFAMEVVSVGIMYYAALVPCVAASVLAMWIARAFGAVPEKHLITGVPAAELRPFFQVILLAALCAAVSVGFCYLLQNAGKLYKKYISNVYLRAAAGGALVLLLMLAVGTRDYMGAGMDMISAALKGSARPEAFLLKAVFTALTLGAGFKGGEIVPGFFVGATFGCFAGGLIGLSPSFGAAVGLLSVFCGITNCPLASLAMSVELFGANGITFYFLAIAVSYMLSGYTGLYSRQKIMYSKYRPGFIGQR